EDDFWVTPAQRPANRQTIRSTNRQPGFTSSLINPPSLASATEAESQVQRTTDDFFHDLGGSAVNGLDPRIQIRLRDGIFAHVPVAAVQLQALIGGLLLQFGGPPFAHGG